jgi:hypothetical protein
MDIAKQEGGEGIFVPDVLTGNITTHLEWQNARIVLLARLLFT